MPVDVEKASYEGSALIRMRKLVMYGYLMFERCKRTEGVQRRKVVLTIRFAPGLKGVVNQTDVHKLKREPEYLDPKLFRDAPELIDNNQNYQNYPSPVGTTKKLRQNH